MKNIIYILLPFFLFSCEKLPVNGKLDGMWQLMKIEYADGRTALPKKTYYSIQLELVKLNQIHEGSIHGSKTDYFVGRFKQTKDSLSFYDIRFTPDENRTATSTDLMPFGLNANSNQFAINELTNSKMVLISKEIKLHFRKF